MPLDMTNWSEPERKEPSLEGLIEFCERQPMGKTYCYDASGSCALGSYLYSLGLISLVSADEDIPGQFFAEYDRGFSATERWRLEDALMLGTDGSPLLSGRPRTYGALATRLRALLRETAAVG